MGRTSRSALAVVFIAAISVAASACGSGTITAETAPVDDETSSTEFAETETPTISEPTTEAPSAGEGRTMTDDETDAVPASDDGGAADSPGEAGSAAGSGGGDDDGSCIEGDWSISDEELDGYYAALGAASGVPMSAKGSTQIRFMDFQFVYDAVFELEMDIEGLPTVADANGVATGSYIVADGIISTEVLANSLSIIVDVGGFEIDAGEFGNDLLTSFPINDTPYSCDGPTIFFKTSDTERHPVVLTPYEG